MNNVEFDPVDKTRAISADIAAQSANAGCIERFPPVLTGAIENPLLRLLQSQLPELKVKKLLHHRGVPRVDNNDGLSMEQKLLALASLPRAYRPTIDAARFAQRVVMQMHVSLELRNPQDPRYLRFYYDQADVMRGGKIKPMPEFLESLTGAGFLLAGPSGSGKTVFLQRLRALVGERHTKIIGIGDAPAEFIFVPMLILRWPDCGTLFGLLANLRNALIGELGCSQTSENAFANLLGPFGPSAAIATCVFLNLGLLAVDGMCKQSLYGDPKEILDFIATFKARTGIPTIVCCTYPALQLIARGGSKHANFGSLGQEYWDLEPPGANWDAMCTWFWGLGFHAADIHMPEYLPTMMWGASLGNMRVFAQGFDAILHHAVYEPRFFANAPASEVAYLLGLWLRMFDEPLMLLKRIQNQKKSEPMPNPTPADLYHADYLPFAAFSGTSRELLETKPRARADSPVKQKRP
ncbi:hypothetical protein [Rugamonas sp.]|uniref:hypothetical protein n=1 Tax=Rugamonas sp. TaxID=1926287 RepID=UPI0026008EC9|nr:hypothetical protein [Rugamonas sp.]